MKDSKLKSASERALDRADSIYSKDLTKTTYKNKEEPNKGGTAMKVVAQTPSGIKQLEDKGGRLYIQLPNGEIRRMKKK